MELPQRKLLPILGTQVNKLNKKNLKHSRDNTDFESNARALRCEREAEGTGGRYSKMQPTIMPPIDKNLIGKRLDICEKYSLDKGGSELRWSQGKVVLVSNGSNI